jgi:hypothetical protein
MGQGQYGAVSSEIMRNNYVFICLLLVSIACFAQPQQTASGAAADREKLNVLHRRVSEKDYSVFSEAKELPGSISVPFIWFYARAQGADPQVRPIALDALKHVHGFKEYFQKELAKITDQEGDPWGEHEILIAIGNLEAAEVLAPYLFDFRVPPSQGDVGGAVYNFGAAWALSQMHFADAPTSEDPSKYGPEEDIAWQKWAIAHKMMPKEWEARIGVPNWQYKIDPNRQRRLGRNGQMPDPGDAKRVGPPSPGNPGISQQEGRATNPTAPIGTVDKTGESTPLPGGWALWGGIAAVLAAAAGWLLFRAKGKARKG